MKIFLFLFLFLLISFIPSKKVFASSDYVLPYPSAMPGSSFYKIEKIYEVLSKYWYFGDFGHFDYNLKYSNKYLVEAKTLFEYKQYLLADKALKKSNYYFSNIKKYLVSAKNHNKKISEKENLLKQVSKKHIEVLTVLKTTVPLSFVWSPEKSTPIELKLQKAVDESIALRKKDL